jgi:hypothetical protein
MNRITEEDLTLLYYGEHKDPGLATRVAGSKELSARFDALSTELQLVDAYQPPERGENYGAEVWQRIAPHLQAGVTAESKRSGSWWRGLLQPRFSLAGLFGVVLVAVLAFLLGQSGNLAVPRGADTVPVAEFAAVDSARLLSASVAGHLDQLNVMLTGFAHGEGQSSDEAEWAMNMLVANRLYRQTASATGNRRLAGFLSGIEPLLIELAYEAHTASQSARERMQQEVRDDLLFKIRVMNNQLKNRQIST